MQHTTITAHIISGLTTAAIALAGAGARAAPAPPSPDAPSGSAEDDVVRAATDAELIVTEGGIQIIAYNDEGEVVGQLGLWLEAGGTTTILADYSDGYSLTQVTADDDVATTTTVPRELLEARYAAIVDILDGGPYAGWVPCAWGVGAAAVACGAIRPVLCLGGTYVAACSCLPLLIEEFEGIKCPGM